MAAAGLAPRDLAGRPRPVVFADIVSVGGTFEALYGLIRDWIDDERVPWRAVRPKLRFLGVTARKHTSPTTWRWQQRSAWTADLPPRAVVNVSLAPDVWRCLGEVQHKLTRSFHRGRWADPEVTRPPRDEAARAALAEAVSLVRAGRDREVRRRLARVMAGEPAVTEPWLRALAAELRA
ncbi:hypothetical protein DPM19_04105 [Actinomadura craniellae]|uniref:Uncharacterized protein n=1 Tax=Actinomadura craniellae TaxID=2231787 RepID=A0A365HBS0_9ACTN|nr:hypothetical protein DPM19_04105 [Actinomadura craniellae]